MNKLTRNLLIALYIFTAYLFFTCETRADEIESNEINIYEFCIKKDFINVRYCLAYLQDCIYDEGIINTNWCVEDYKLYTK